MMGRGVNISVETLDGDRLVDALAAADFKEPIDRLHTELGHVRLIPPIAGPLFKRRHAATTRPRKDLLRIMMQDQPGHINLRRCLAQAHLDMGRLSAFLPVPCRHRISDVSLEHIQGALGHTQHWRSQRKRQQTA